MAPGAACACVHGRGTMDGISGRCLGRVPLHLGISCLICFSPPTAHCVVNGIKNPVINFSSMDFLGLVDNQRVLVRITTPV